MKRLYKITAVTLVTALFISMFCIFGSAAEVGGGVFTPTVGYPYASSLIYGDDTLVIDINWIEDYPELFFYRYQVPSDSIFWVTRNYSGGKYYYMLNILSNEPVMSYVANLNNNTYQYEVAEMTNYGPAYGYSYWHYQSVSYSNNYTFLCRATKKWEVPSGLTLGSGVVLVENTVWTYPTVEYVQNNQQHQEVMTELQNGFQAIDNRLESGFSSVNQGLQEGFSSVNEAITNAAGEIINAGSDMPTLDTNNDWMNDSLTKVNEWVSQLEAFEEQMEAAEEENSENMAHAKSFLDGFFDVLPKPLIAVLTLGLVMIVVVKVIGR